MKQLRIAAGIGALLALAACGSGNGNVQLTKSGLNPENSRQSSKATLPPCSLSSTQTAQRLA